MPVVENQKSTASVQAKTSPPGTVKLHVTFGFFDENRSVLSEGSRDFALTGSYDIFTIDGTAPATAV